MPSAQPTLDPPVDALLAQVGLLLREGVDGWIRPDPFPDPYWPTWNARPESSRQACPAGHFLFPAGLRLYVDDQFSKIQTPACIVELDGEPAPLDERVPSVFWNIPVKVELIWPGDQVTDSEIRKRLHMLLGLLVNDYPATDDSAARPIQDRLSVPDVLLVYGNDCISAVKTEPLRTMEGHPVARVSFTVLCSALPPADD